MFKDCLFEATNAMSTKGQSTWNEDALRVIKAGRRVSIESGHGFVALEHILFGLASVAPIKEGGEVVLSPDRIREAMKSHDGLCERMVILGHRAHPPETPRYKRVIERATQLAQTPGPVTTVHLWLAVLEEAESDIRDGFGIEPEDLKRGLAEP